MTAPLHGDPASCSQTGGALRRLASTLEAASVRAGQAGSHAEESWTGRVARDIGKRRGLLVETTQTTAAQLDRTGMALQAHATDLAEALHEARAVEERATVAGLRVVDGQVRLPWGVSGVADATSRRRSWHGADSGWSRHSARPASSSLSRPAPSAPDGAAQGPAKVDSSWASARARYSRSSAAAPSRSPASSRPQISSLMSR